MTLERILLILALAVAAPIASAQAAPTAITSGGCASCGVAFQSRGLNSLSVAAPGPQVGQPLASTSAATAGQHPFWDEENRWLFAGVAAARTLDYFSTLNMRRRGRQEILLTNDVVDDHAGFAAIEAAGTGLSIGASYLFHRYGHHRLERWTSIVHISLTTTGAVRNYCLVTRHPQPASYTNIRTVH